MDIPPPYQTICLTNTQFDAVSISALLSPSVPPHGLANYQKTTTTEPSHGASCLPARNGDDSPNARDQDKNHASNRFG